MDNLRKSIGARLQALRKARSLTQAESDHYYIVTGPPGQELALCELTTIESAGNDFHARLFLKIAGHAWGDEIDPVIEVNTLLLTLISRHAGRARGKGDRQGKCSNPFHKYPIS